MYMIQHSDSFAVIDRAFDLERFRVTCATVWCYTEKATEVRHRLERQHNACANRKKQCRPNETKPHSNATHPRKRKNNPTNGHTPSRITSTHTHLTYNAWQRRGTQKTRNTYNQPNRPNRQTSQTKHQALPKGQPGRCITPINTAAVHASAQQQPTTACGPDSPELSKSYMDMASKLFTFKFTAHTPDRVITISFQPTQPAAKPRSSTGGLVEQAGWLMRRAEPHNKKQCRPNETEPYSNATHPRKRKKYPTYGHTPSRIKSTHTRLAYTAAVWHVPWYALVYFAAMLMCSM